MHNRFAPLVAQLATLVEGGSEEVQVGPPATPADRAELTRALGRPLPPELLELLEVTVGIEVEGKSLDLQTEGYPVTLTPWDDGAPVLRVEDYGNGDGLFLDTRDGTCRLWWFGHDSYDFVLVARSLHEYVSRLVASASDEDVCVTTPADEIEAMSLAKALRAEHDERALGFLRSLPPGANVFDLRRAELPVELRTAYEDRGFRSHGDFVAKLDGEEIDDLDVVFVPGGGFGHAVLGASTAEEVLAAFGTDCNVSRYESGEIFAISYDYRDDEDYAPGRPEQRRRPGGFAFEFGLLKSIEIGPEQIYMVTPAGIRVGTPIAEVKRLLGAPNVVHGGALATHRYLDLGIDFEVGSDDEVAAMVIFRARRRD